MGKGDDTGHQGSANSESEEPQEEEVLEVLDEAYVAEVFERYRPVPFG